MVTLTIRAYAKAIQIDDIFFYIVAFGAGHVHNDYFNQNVDNSFCYLLVVLRAVVLRPERW